MSARDGLTVIERDDYPRDLRGGYDYWKAVAKAWGDEMDRLRGEVERLTAAYQGAVGIIETARQELRDAIADGNPQVLREYAEDAVEAMSAYLDRLGGQS